MLEQAIRRYQNRAIEAAQVIEELIQLARDMREANARGEKLGLSEDELAFYDALETNDSAVKVLGDETLRAIARELVAVGRQRLHGGGVHRQASRPAVTADCTAQKDAFARGDRNALWRNLDCQHGSTIESNVANNRLVCVCTE
jgi:hypothetical protein